MEFWEETMNGTGKLVLVSGEHTNEYACNFEMSQSITGQINLIIKPQNANGMQINNQLVNEVKNNQGVRLFLKGEIEEDWQLEPISIFPDLYRKWSFNTGILWSTTDIYLYPSDVKLVSKITEINSNQKTIFTFDLINASWLLNFPPYEFESDSYHFQIKPYLDQASLENYKQLSDYLVAPFSIVDTYLFFDRYPSFDVLVTYVDAILLLFKIISGSSVDTVRIAETTVGQNIRTIHFKNVVAEKSSLYNPTILNATDFYDIIANHTNTVIMMSQNDRKKLLPALHYTLKGKNEFMVENRIINALIALEILFSEGCPSNKSFDPQCLERLLNNLHIPYPPAEFINPIGRIAGVRGELMHNGVLPEHIVNCDAECFLRCILSLLDEIFLRKIGYSGLFFDIARNRVRNVGVV